MRRVVPSMIILALFIGSGCGGGAEPIAAGDHTASMGAFSITYKGPGPLQPAVTGQSMEVSVTGIDSANYSQIIFNPAKVMGATSIAFNEKDSLWTMGSAGGRAVRVTP